MDVALAGFGTVFASFFAIMNPFANTPAFLGIAPLAMPLLAGPGTLVTGMSFATGSDGGLVVVLVAFFVACVITDGCFLGGKAITRVLGTNFIMVISRVMGLILAVVGTQMLVDGRRAAIAAGP